MGKRLEYIDAIKGFAILLVIMGHVIPCAYGDFQTYHVNDINHEHILWSMIYSFHMPLFMFCSGLFIPVFSKQTIFRDYWTFIKKRFKTLVIPYFCSGFLLLYITNNPDFYWFILFLFFFIIINTSVDYYCSKIGLNHWANILVYIAIAVLIRLIYNKFGVFEVKPILDIEHWLYYKYFCLGTIAMRYGLMEKLSINNHVFTFSLVGFALLFWCNYFSIANIPFTNIFKSLFAIFAVFYIFRNHVEKSPRLNAFFQYLGNKSLELYIVHFFFLVKMPIMGEKFFVKIYEWGGVISVFNISLIWSLIGSAVVILFSLVTIYIIKCSKLLSPLLLGRDGFLIS